MKHGILSSLPIAAVDPSLAHMSTHLESTAATDSFNLSSSHGSLFSPSSPTDALNFYSRQGDFWDTCPKVHCSRTYRSAAIGGKAGRSQRMLLQSVPSAHIEHGLCGSETGRPTSSLLRPKLICFRGGLAAQPSRSWSRSPSCQPSVACSRSSVGLPSHGTACHQWLRQRRMDRAP